MIDILSQIETMRIMRNWTEYELSRRAEIPQSTISSWYRKRQMPTLHSLEKICTAFGITLSAMTAGEGDLMELTSSEKEMLHLFHLLSPKQTDFFIILLKSFDEPEEKQG